MSSRELPALVPAPRTLEVGEGQFRLPAELAVDGPASWAATVRRLLSPGTGLDLPEHTSGAFSLVQESGLAAEAYRLTVTSEGIEIRASTRAGVVWATQTLRQLLPPSVLLPAPSGDVLTVPAVVVEDEPRFAWRGVMIDVGRHFLPLGDLFRLVDLLSLHKHNVLHLHLSEDQGWRFGSDRYPALAQTASWRAETQRPTDETGDGTPHGGWYSPSQLRSLVTYADQRGVSVVPELDLPGHARALLAAYPRMGNHPDVALRTATTFGVLEEVLNLEDSTMEVVLDLYDELLDVFPAPFVHVGGDECPTTEWQASAAAARLAARRGLDGPQSLQPWFTQQLGAWLGARGRTLVGWDEVAEAPDLPPGSVVMAWRSHEHGRSAAARGHEVVMAPASHLYLDHYASDGAEEPYAFGGLTTTRTVHGYDPLEGFDEQGARRVLGTQCQLWTEYVPSMRQVEYMLFPRACAHSEVAWGTARERTWDDFAARLAVHERRLDALGLNHRPQDGPRPWQRAGTGVLRRPE